MRVLARAPRPLASAQPHLRRAQAAFFLLKPRLPLTWKSHASRHRRSLRDAPQASLASAVRGRNSFAFLFLPLCLSAFANSPVLSLPRVFVRLWARVSVCERVELTCMPKRALVRECARHTGRITLCGAAAFLYLRSYAWASAQRLATIRGFLTKAYTCSLFHRGPHMSVRCTPAYVLWARVHGANFLAIASASRPV